MYVEVRKRRNGFHHGSKLAAPPSHGGYKHLISLPLSSTLQTPKKPPTTAPLVPGHLIQQLHTIRAIINQLTRLQPTTAATTATTKSTTPSDLLLHSRLSPIASSYHNHADLLHKYMTYTPYSLCSPNSNSIAKSLILRGCHPLPCRCYFSKTPPKPTSSLPHNLFTITQIQLSHSLKPETWLQPIS